jgi:hypothetical protein
MWGEIDEVRGKGKGSGREIREKGPGKWIRKRDEETWMSGERS